MQTAPPDPAESRHATKAALLVVAGTAILVRAVFLIEYRHSPFYDFLHIDPLYYYQWAERIAGGDWLGTQVFEQAPLYAYLLAAYLKIAGPGLDLLRVLQLGAGVFTSLLVCMAGTRVFSRGAGLAAGLLAAAYGPFLFYEGQVMKEFLTPLFSAGMILAYYRGLEEGGGRRRWLVAAGACIGAAALVRDNFLLLLPLLAVHLAVARPRLRVSGISALVAGALVFLAPAAARNYAVSGDFVLTTSGGGEVFYIGNGPYANGAYVPPPWVRHTTKYEHEDFRKRAREVSGRDLTRAQASRFWWKEGLKSILDHPLRFAGLEARKALIFLNDYELPDNYSYYSFRRFARVLRVLPTFGILIVLAVPGVAASAARWRQLVPVYLAGLGYMASVMIFFNFARFRLPFVPIACLLAGEGVMALGRWARGLRDRAPGAWRAPAAGLAAMLVTGAVCTVDLHSNAEEPFQDRLHLAAAYLQAGDLERSEATLRATIQDAREVLLRRGWREGSRTIPGGIPFAIALHAAYRDLASVLVRQGKTEAAIRQMREAIPFDPNDAAIYQMLGTAYTATGRPDDAVSALREGVALAPTSFTMRFDLATALYEAGDREAALEQMREAGANPSALPDLDRADWHIGMGTLLLDVPGRREEALRHLREGLALNPGHPHAAEVRRALSGPG